jgi:hypothetical protein
MKTNFRFVISMLALVALFAVSAFAQRTTGDIEGVVTDPSGAVVPNVTVTIVSAQSTGGGAEANVTSGFRRTVQTDSNGYYRVQQVPPGSYLVTTAAISGFGEGRVPNVRVSVDNTTRADIALLAAGATAQVDISADDAPPIDTGGSKIQSNITSQRIELLPKGVDFTSVLKTVPGTRPEGNAGGVSVDGASGSENAFYIDGQEVTNFRTGTLNGNNAIPTQFVQEVQVKSSGFEAEFGGATGGVISVMTKGGSNDWRGEFGVQFTTPKLNGGNRPTLYRFSNNSTEYLTAPKSEGSNFFPTANLSGPIIKDRLWFFGSYSPQYFNTTNRATYYSNAPAATRVVTATETYRFKRTYEYAFLRLDASPTDNLRLTGTYTWNPIIDEGALPVGTISIGGAPPVVNFGGNIGTLRGAQLTDRQGGRQNSNNITAQAVWTPTSKLVISGRFSRGFLNEKLGSYFVPTGTRFICQYGSPSIGCSTGFADPANSNVFKDVSIRENYEVDASYLVSNFGGRHEFKGGYQRFKIKNDVDRGYVDAGRVDLYVQTPGIATPEAPYQDIISIADLGAPVTPTCVGGTCLYDEDGYITNPAYIGAGEVIRFGTKGVGSNLNQSIYIQDRWQPTSRLTLNLGVRMEKEDLPSFNGLAPPINFGFFDKISPRLGFAYDLTGDGKTKVFAFYGKFFDRLKFELPRGSFGGDFYRVDFFEVFAGDGDFRSFTVDRVLGNYDDAPGGTCPTTGFIGSGISRCQFDYRIASNDPNATIFTGAVDPELKPFQQTEFTAGLERQLSRDYVIKGRYTFKNVDKAIEDAGIITPGGSEAYIIGNPGEGLHAELLNELGYDRITKPQRRYNAVEVQLDKRLSSNYYFNLNYTWSRLYGNYSGLASSDEAGRTSPGVNRFFDLPMIGFTLAGEPDNGLLATDRTHVFNAYGSYILDWWGSKTNTTEFSGFTTFQSGTPVTTTIPWITTVIYTERGDLGRTPMFTQTDFAVSHKYRFGRDNRFTFAADLNIINLFNEDNITGYYTQKSTVTLQPNTTGAYGTQFIDFNDPETSLDDTVNFVRAINAYTSGSILTATESYLQGNSTRIDGRYGQANAYQGPRSVRFGFRLLF